MPIEPELHRVGIRDREKAAGLKNSERIISELLSLRVSLKRVHVQHTNTIRGFPLARISTLVRYLTRKICPEDYDCVQLGLSQEKEPCTQHTTPPTYDSESLYHGPITKRSLR